MRAIPPKMRKTLSEDPAMEKCIACHNTQVSWHHPFCYGRSQINELWSICPLCYYHHQGEGWTEEVRVMCEKWCLARATDDDLAKYPKRDWNMLK